MLETGHRNQSLVRPTEDYVVPSPMKDVRLEPTEVIVVKEDDEQDT